MRLDFDFGARPNQVKTKCSDAAEVNHSNRHFVFLLICYRIATHRVVVSAASEYFEAMFTTSMKEKDMKEVPLGAVSGTILKSLIEYCYTGEFHIDSENVIDALEAARMFRFDNLFASCAKYLKNTLSNESCFKVWNTAILYDLYELATVSLNYICENFWLLIGTEVFCRITAAELMAIFDCNAIAVESEDDLFKSIIKWIEFDVDNRREEFEGLVATIRWSQISHLVRSSVRGFQYISSLTFFWF